MSFPPRADAFWRDEARPVRWSGQRIAKRPRQAGGEVVAIAPGSPAEELDLRPGDRVLAVNGQAMRDVIDFQFAAADDSLALVIERSGHTRTLRARGEQAVGVRFRDPAFDGITWCNNKCPFCFVKMNPGGARASLYLKDDDFRYSALYGNFVTLTNLTEENWRRIEEQRLGPLYVSVHATDRELRRRLLGNPSAPDVLAQLDRLAGLGIAYHTQAVLCPGLNDGPELDRTIGEIASRHPHARSLSLVPVGLTGVGRQPPYLRRHTAAEAEAILERAGAYRRRFRRELGSTFLYPSDELYLMAARRLPPARHYDGYGQYQNGVGMVRSLLDEWSRLRRTLGRRRLTRSATAVTGTLIAPFLRPMLAEIADVGRIGIELQPVENRYFGAIVNVAGLLTGRDVLAALKARPGDPGDLVVLPRASLDTPGERFLDDMTPAELAAELGRPLVFVETLRDLVRALAGSDQGVVPCAA
jgi:putative radical SAM enzyme (TIGR03279 family)